MQRVVGERAVEAVRVEHARPLQVREPRQPLAGPDLGESQVQADHGLVARQRPQRRKRRARTVARVPVNRTGDLDPDVAGWELPLGGLHLGRGAAGNVAGQVDAKRRRAGERLRLRRPGGGIRPSPTGQQHDRDRRRGTRPQGGAEHDHQPPPPCGNNCRSGLVHKSTRMEFGSIPG